MPYITHTIEGQEIQIHYETQGTGEPIVFLHGFPECAHQWYKQMAYFSKQYQVIAPNLRGYNRSSKPVNASDYEIHKLVGDVLALCDALHLSKIYLVGHDWGGVIAWVLASLHPDRIKKLVILNAPHPTVYQHLIRHNPIQQKAAEYIVMLKSPLAVKLLARKDYEWLRQQVLAKGLARGTLTQADVDQYIDAWSQPGALEAMTRYYQTTSLPMLSDGKPDWTRFSFMPTLEEVQLNITVPTLVIWGEQDNALMLENLLNLAPFVKQLTVERIPEAGHFLVHEQSEKINQLIEGFFMKQAFEKDVSSAEITGVYRCVYPEWSGDTLSEKLVSPAGRERAAAFIEKYNYPLVNQKISLRAGYFLQEATRLLQTGHYDSCISFASGFSLLIYYIAAQNQNISNIQYFDTDYAHMIQEREQRISQVKSLNSSILGHIRTQACDVERMYLEGRSLRSIFPTCKRPIFIGEGLTYFISPACMDWLITEMGSYECSATIVDYWPDDMMQISSLFARVFQDLNKGMILEPLKSFWTKETMALFKKEFPKMLDLSLPEVETILSAKLVSPPKPAMLDPNQYFPLRMIVGEN